MLPHEAITCNSCRSMSGCPFRTVSRAVCGIQKLLSQIQVATAANRAQPAGSVTVCRQILQLRWSLPRTRADRPKLSVYELTTTAFKACGLRRLCGCSDGVGNLIRASLEWKQDALRQTRPRRVPGMRFKSDSRWSVRLARDHPMGQEPLSCAVLTASGLSRLRGLTILCGLCRSG